jgi:hypothetical protein
VKGNPRAGLLIAAALLMFFAAFGNALVMVPDLRGDLIEIGVRPTVLRGTVSALYFAAAAMFIFALMVAQAARQSMRGAPISRLPLAIIAIIHTVAGAMAFARSHNPHHLGGMLMGVLLGVALLIRPSNSGGHP